MFKYCNIDQLVLPLNLEIKLQKNDIAYAAHNVVEKISDEAFAHFEHDIGFPAYQPRMIMKVILYAYTQSVFSGTKIGG